MVLLLINPVKRPQRKLSLSLALRSLAAGSLMLACAPALADCLLPGRDDLRARQRIGYAAGQAEVVRISQAGEDIIAVVDAGSERYSINHPGGIGIAEYVVLPTTAAGSAIELCLYPAYPHSSPGAATVSVEPFSAFSATAQILLPVFSRAARAWADNTASSREQALQEYRRGVGNIATVTDDLQRDLLLFEVNALARKADYALVLESIAAAERLDLADPVLHYKLNWRKGEALLRQQRLPEAVDVLALALAQVEALPTAVVFAREATEIRLMLGEARLASGQLDAGRQTILASKTGAEADFRLLGRLHSSLGYIDFMDSQQPGLVLQDRYRLLAASVDNLLTGRLYAESATDTVALAGIDNDLGFVYDRLGEHQRALKHFQQVLALANPEDDPLVHRATSSNLGRIYQYLADYPRSASYYRQVVSLDEASNQRLSLAHCPLGTTLRLQGNIAEATTRHEDCLDAARKAGNPNSEVLALLELGEDYLAAGDDARARSFIEAAWRLDASKLNPNDRARLLRRYALLQAAAANFSEAESVLAQTLALETNDRDRLSPAALVESRVLAMELAVQQQQWRRADTEGLAAITQAEALYAELESERLGPAWSDRTHGIYVRLAELLLQRYQQSNDNALLQQAYAVTERSRAISLRQQLGHGAGPGQQTDNQQARQAQLDKIAAIANSHATASTMAIQLPPDYYRQQDLLSLYRLGNLQTVPIPAPLAVATIQQRLEENQALLMYLLAERDSYAFVITRDGMQVRNLGATATLTALLAQAKTGLSDNAGALFASLPELSAMLLPTALLPASIESLLVVPHGELTGFAFAALDVDPAGDSYTPLPATYTVKMLPSASAYFMDKPVADAAREYDIAILADPQFATAALQTAANAVPVDNGLRGWTNALARLPATAVEADNIRRVFDTRRTLLYTGAAATRATLTQQSVRSAGILHLATHGYFNGNSDESVGLAFAPALQNGQNDSGFVTLSDLFSLPFSNELVVISGCDTALGREAAGEGMLSLTRGFLAQGVKHVISTLWPVSDRASAEFMRLFYQSLAAQEDVALALQLAQQQMSANATYRNPYYWAGYVLTTVAPDSSLRLQD